MPVEIHITRGEGASPSLESHRKRGEEIDNQKMGEWIIEGFMSGFPVIGELPALKHDVFIAVGQSRRVIGDIALFDTAYTRRGVGGIRLLANLFEEKIAKRDVEPYTREGKPGIGLSVTLYVERIRDRLSKIQPEYHLGFEDVTKAIGMYLRLWMFHYEYPEHRVRDKRLGDYNKYGLLDLTEECLWMNKDSDI